MSEYISPHQIKQPVKVRVGYADGNHWLEEYTPKMAELGLPYVEVDRHTWAQWEAHCAACSAWNSLCIALGNELYEKENAQLEKESQKK
jgi:hypothetical protein